MNIQLRDLLQLYQQLSANNQLVKTTDTIVENIPLEPAWRQLSSLLLEKIKHLKKCTTVRRVIRFSIDLSEEEEEEMLRMVLQLIDSGDPLINEKVSHFLSEFLVVIRAETYSLSMDGFLVGVYQGVMKHWERTITQRPALLGGDDMINIDETTGWQRLECFLRLYHATCFGILRRRSFELLTCEPLSVPPPTPPQTSSSNSDLSSSSTSSILLELLTTRVVEEEGRRSEKIEWFDRMVRNMAKHSNRHFREMTFHFLAEIFPLLSNNNNFFKAQIRQIGFSCLELLVGGLEDDWSQIRYAATTAFHSITNSFAKQELYMDDPSLQDIVFNLIPRICLNRFHPAKSIQSLSLETWKTHFGRDGFGRNMLVQSIIGVVEYYIQATKHKNHMICEAACCAIGEVLSKLTSSVPCSLIEQLLLTMSASLQDERWPVRDAALLPSSLLFRYYAREYSSLLSVELLQSFLFLWRQRLQDAIWSVRENAAVAFLEAMQSNDNAIADFVKSFCFQYIEEHFFEALKSPSTPWTTESSMFFEIPAAGNLRGRNSLNRTSFLPQTMLKGPLSNHSNENSKVDAFKKGWGCCIDCAELKKSASWEITHGTIYLLREFYRSSRSFTFSQSFSFLLHSSNHKQAAANREEMSVFDAIKRLLQSSDYDHADKLQAAFLQEIPILASILQERAVKYSDATAIEEEERNCLVKAISSWLALEEGVINHLVTPHLEVHKATDARILMMEECKETMQREFPFLWSEIGDFMTSS